MVKNIEIENCKFKLYCRTKTTAEEHTDVIHLNFYIKYLGFAKACHSHESLVIINGHDTRNYWTSNSNLPTVIHKLEKDISVIEQLSDY